MSQDQLRPESRRERLAELRGQDARRARRKSRTRTLATVLAVVVVLCAGAAALVTVSGGPGETTAPVSGVDPDKANVRGEKLYPDLAREHVTGHVDYPDAPKPPVGGKHNPLWQNANGDVYTRPLQNEHAVHSLEHGAVWVTYSKDDPPADVAALRAKVEGRPYRMLSPVPDQPGRVELTAWGHQLSVASASDPRVDAFLDAYVQGPQAPEPGAPVTGGRATP